MRLVNKHAGLAERQGVAVDEAAFMRWLAGRLGFSKRSAPRPAQASEGTGLPRADAVIASIR